MPPADSFDDIPELHPFSDDTPLTTTRPLPSSLLQTVVFSWCLGIATFIFFICIALRLHDPTYVSGCLIGAFLIARGIHIHILWRSGGIQEMCLRCVSCHRVRTTKLLSISSEVYSIVCTDDDADAPKLFEFRLGRGGQDFSANVRAIFYINTNAPRTPIAWTLV